MQLSPESVNMSIFSADTIKECGDCRRKDGKIVDLDSRVKELTDYIKNSNERLNSEKKKYEDEIKRLNIAGRSRTDPK